MPASDTSATCPPPAIRSTSSGARACSLCSCSDIRRVEMPWAAHRVAVRRVSSQAMTSAERQRLDHAHGDVAQVPDRRRAHRQAAAHDRISAAAPSTPAVLPSFAGAIVASCSGARQRPPAGLVARRAEDQLAGRGDAAADDHSLRVEDVDVVGDPHPQVPAHHRQRLDALRLTGEPALDHMMHVQRRRRCGRRRGSRRDARSAIAVSRVHHAHRRGHHLETSMVGAVALAGRPVLGHHHVAELAAVAGRAPVDPAVDHDPAAHPGAEREHDHVAERRGRRRPAPRPGRPHWRRCRSRPAARAGASSPP